MLNGQEGEGSSLDSVKASDPAALQALLLSGARPRVHIFVGVLDRSDLQDPSTADISFETLLSNEYGKTDSVKDLRTVLLALGYPTVEVHEVTLSNFSRLLDRFESESQASGVPFVVFNLCDGTETDGYPGISVNHALEARGIPYTGADSHFFCVTTSKTDLKDVLRRHAVPTSLFVDLKLDALESNIEEAERLIGYPMIVKPSVSYASLSITDKSVVFDRASAIEQAKGVLDSKLGEGGVFVEKFLPGREFTALVIGGKSSRAWT